MRMHETTMRVCGELRQLGMDIDFGLHGILMNPSVYNNEGGDVNPLTEPSRLRLAVEK